MIRTEGSAFEAVGLSRKDVSMNKGMLALQIPLKLRFSALRLQREHPEMCLGLFAKILYLVSKLEELVLLTLWCGRVNLNGALRRHGWILSYQLD